MVLDRSGDAGSPRASDRDRDRVAEALRQHYAEGRLTTDEHTQRLELVYTARTMGELQALTHDLPVQADAGPRPKRKRKKKSAVRMSFDIHFAVYAVVILFLVIIWALTMFGGYFWPIWPALGWGVGLGIHGAVTYQKERYDEEHEPAPVRVSAPPAPPRPSGPQRHWIAVMFTDIANSTSLTEALGDSEWSRLRARHREVLRELFAAHKGREVSAQGDGFLARFPAPANAVRCAVAIQRRLEDMREQGAVVPKVRIGIHAGEAMSEDDGDVVGHVVNLASRVTAEAEPSEIVVTEPVADHAGDVVLEDRGLRTLRGVSTPRHLLSVRWS